MDIKNALNLIMEGVILNESDVIDFTARQRVKTYENQIREYTAQVTKMTAEVHRQWTILESKKKSGLLTGEQFIEQMMALQPTTSRIREIETQINILQDKIDGLSSHA
jgi:uncharacterized protein Yka (UPF0111/DUF47 family)